MDFRIGRFYTMMTHELSPATQTEFYSHSYEFFFGPYTHLGIMAILHASDTLDIHFAVVRGWDVWEDNNNVPTYHGMFNWTSCDKRFNWANAWIAGPEQTGNDDDWRVAITSWFTATFGRYNQFKTIVGGNWTLEKNAIASTDLAGNPIRDDAEWYSVGYYFLWTVDPRLILGMRAEWFRDDDGYRTAIFKRPVGFPTNFYEVTLGFTYKPYQNVRIRPEIRYDWADNGTTFGGAPVQPFDDQQRLRQFTAAVDLIWEF
jgi:hypothetical protein